VPATQTAVYKIKRSQISLPENNVTQVGSVPIKNAVFHAEGVLDHSYPELASPALYCTS